MISTRIPSAPPRSMARGSGWTSRSTVRIRSGAGRVLSLRRPRRRGGAPAGEARRPAEGSGADRLVGICWRVADLDAAHARLAAAGVDVCRVRAAGGRARG